jgi:hypothetical protein
LVDSNIFETIKRKEISEFMIYEYLVDFTNTISPAVMASLRNIQNLDKFIPERYLYFFLISQEENKLSFYHVYR